MANEVTVSASLAYEDSEGSDILLAVSDLLANVSSKKFAWMKQSVGLSEEAINLGEATAPGWAILVNRDETNFINLKVGTGGAIFCKMLAGEFALLRLGSGAQVPYAIADTAACQMEYAIINT